MSSINDYVACSNNSINDNMYNTKKARSKIHKIKQLLKPVFAVLKRNSAKNTYRKTAQPEYYIDEEYENEQNLANEILEQRIFEEIDVCPDFAGVPVYSNGYMDVVPVSQGQQYIPVHFAKTDAGTFFWTSVSAADSDICYSSEKYATSEYQTPESQVPCDRWAQA
ncbi:ocho [Carabus blaptoides fortunei]